ncbi:MAG: hypothetical protein J0I54_12735 [Bosea sp.]|uniref:hypothetical protein n=1 Tax=unclassified Bosea (in: a-proteobacteria) TaxID=2653178 RepID=UPI000A6186C3|nr:MULTISPECIES: hypothetical protein [unclassified Bosea (in: a-proteobacteria)]MBN9457487.1 hypothetical protein [Bosea sp. (in: a-proteobacteria)]
MRTPTIEEAERRLDEMAAEAIRRAGERIERNGVTGPERARQMATARSVIKAWRARATAAALRDAVSVGGSGR